MMGKGHIKSNCPQKVSDDKKKSDSKRSPWTDNVMPVTAVATAQGHELTDEIFAIAVGGSLGSACGAGEIAELMDSGAAEPFWLKPFALRVHFATL